MENEELINSTAPVKQRKLDFKVYDKSQIGVRWEIVTRFSNPTWTALTTSRFFDIRAIYTRKNETRLK